MTTWSWRAERNESNYFGAEQKGGKAMGVKERESEPRQTASGREKGERETGRRKEREEEEEDKTGCIIILIRAEPVIPLCQVNWHNVI